MKKIYIIFLVFCLLPGCKKEESLITGDITGYVACLSPFYKTEILPGAMQVTLVRGEEQVAQVTSDENGGFTFSDIPYGKYLILASKEGYVWSSFWQNLDIYHAGGEKPTYALTNLYQVPGFTLVADSMGYLADLEQNVIYLHFTDPEIFSNNFYGLSFLGFISDSPDVSKSNYLARLRGTALDNSLYGYGNNHEQIGFIYMNSANYASMPEDLYLRIYAIAAGQGYYFDQVLPEAFGPPSEVFPFKNPATSP